MFLQQQPMYEYASSYWNSWQQWWNPPPPTPLSPYQQFMQFLSQSNIPFQTRHSDVKILHERLGMMFTELISHNSKEYNFSEFYPSADTPLEYTPTDFQKYNDQVADHSSKTNVNLVSICGKLKVQGEKIKCILFLTILFHREIESNPPIIFIRNFSPTAIQPNHKMSRFYTPVVGGVQVAEEAYKSKIDWSQYNAKNLLILMQCIHRCLHENFPFVKRSITLEFPSQEEMQTFQQMHRKISTLLPAVQQLQIMRYSVRSETGYLQKKKMQLLEYGKILSEEKKTQENLLVKQNAELLELCAEENAGQDCQTGVQKMFENKKITYEKAQDMVKLFAEQVFEAKFKIEKIVSSLSKHD